MSSPAVVFLRNGLISALAALAIWLLPFLLRDDPQDVSDLEPKAPNLKQARSIAALPGQIAEPKTPPLPAAKIEVKAPPQPVLVPLAASTTLPDPTQTQGRIDLRPAPAGKDFDGDLRKPAFDEPPAPRPLPSPIQPAAAHLPLPQEPETHAAASPVFAATPAVLVAPTVPMPDRHPRRLSFLDELAPEIEPRTIQATVRPQAAPASPIAFFTRILRPREQVAHPASVSLSTGSVGSPITPTAVVGPGPQPDATASYTRPARERWKPASCDDPYKFWK